MEWISSFQFNYGILIVSVLGFLFVLSLFLSIFREKVSKFLKIGGLESALSKIFKVIGLFLLAELFWVFLHSELGIFLAIGIGFVVFFKRVDRAGDF